MSGPSGNDFELNAGGLYLVRSQMRRLIAGMADLTRLIPGRVE